MRKLIMNKIKTLVLRAGLVLLPILAYAIEKFVIGALDNCLSKL